MFLKGQALVQGPVPSETREEDLALIRTVGPLPLHAQTYCVKEIKRDARACESTQPAART